MILFVQFDQCPLLLHICLFFIVIIKHQHLNKQQICQSRWVGVQMIDTNATCHVMWLTWHERIKDREITATHLKLHNMSLNYWQHTLITIDKSSTVYMYWAVKYFVIIVTYMQWPLSNNMTGNVFSTRQLLVLWRFNDWP